MLARPSRFLPLSSAVFPRLAPWRGLNRFVYVRPRRVLRRPRERQGAATSVSCHHTPPRRRCTATPRRGRVSQRAVHRIGASGGARGTASGERSIARCNERRAPPARWHAQRLRPHTEPEASRRGKVSGTRLPAPTLSRDDSNRGNGMSSGRRHSSTELRPPASKPRPVVRVYGIPTVRTGGRDCEWEKRSRCSSVFGTLVPDANPECQPYQELGTSPS